MFKGHNTRILFKAVNALAGMTCVFVGVLLPQVELIHISQSPGEGAYLLIQAHWIAIGGVSLLVSRSSEVNQLWVALLVTWGLLNGWLGAEALLHGEPAFFWVLIFPAVALLNFLQASSPGDSGADESHKAEDAQAHDHELNIPADFYELKSSSPATAVMGVLQIALVAVIQITVMVLFFFYGALMVRVLLESASVDLLKIPSTLWDVFLKILYIPTIIAAVYSVVFLIQIVIEKMALTGGESASGDANRALSHQERTFIEQNLQKIKAYIEEIEFPSFYAWSYWPSAIGCIAMFLAFPASILWIESEFFNAVKVSSIPEANVISALGPALVGGAVFGFLFGAAVYWGGYHWLGVRYPGYGEYLHIRRGWNSMSAEPRAFAAYAKIFTRFVRKRRYDVEQVIEPSQFIRDAYAEFSGLIYKSTVVLGLATVLFTYLDVNWRRIDHLAGLHYSPYLDFRSHDLSLDDAVKVELRCFLYEEDDDGERAPGVGYDLLYSNGMRGYLLQGKINPELLSKIETIDERLRGRGIPFVHAKRAGLVILRGLDGYWPDCAETVIPKLEADVRPRVAKLIRADFARLPPKN